MEKGKPIKHHPSLIKFIERHIEEAQESQKIIYEIDSNEFSRRNNELIEAQIFVSINSAKCPQNISLLSFIERGIEQDRELQKLERLFVDMGRPGYTEYLRREIEIAESELFLRVRIDINENN